MAYLLLTCWSGNPAVYADTIIDYLLADSHRLNIGYNIWDAGNGISAITREALSAATPVCSEFRLRRIEDAIRGYYPSSERDDLKSRGYHEYLLLCALPRARMNAITLGRFQELERKFPEIDAGGPFISNSDGIVRSPISKESASRMTDVQWLEAMKTHSSENSKRRSGDDFLTGGADQLATILEQLARENKSRYGKLALQMGADLLPVYFEALLRGIGSPSERRPAGTGSSDVKESLISDEEFKIFIRHCFKTEGEVVGRWLCHAIQSRTHHEFDPEIGQLLVHFATKGVDPVADSWTQDGTGKMYGGDPLTEGINTTRGEAAQGIAALLFAQPDKFPIFRDTIEKLVADKTISVRAVAIDCLLAMLNIDRDEAVRLFLSAVKCDDSILRTHTVGRFVRYAAYSHYGQLRKFLFRLLGSPANNVRKLAAQTIAVVAYNSTKAKKDLPIVISGDEYCRSGVASVDATNFSVDECRDVSRKRLMLFFQDTSSVVRTSAAKVLRKMGPKLLSSEEQLLSSFVESPAFAEHVSTLTYVLKESGSPMPDIVCRIGERAAEVRKAGQTQALWWTQDIGALVLRLYDQTRDPHIQTRCLNVIDQMIEYNFGDLDPKLREFERE
jgi:hypothetical protein